MLRKSILAILTISLMFCISCGGKTPPSAAENQTPNIREFPLPYQKVWKTVLETTEFDFLMGIELQDVKRGFFSTEMIRDYQPFLKRRFRLSGSLISDGKITSVKLYKHEEVLENEVWKAIPSDSSLETQVLNRISKKLARFKK